MSEQDDGDDENPHDINGIIEHQNLKYHQTLEHLVSLFLLLCPDSRNSCSGSRTIHDVEWTIQIADR